MFNRKGAKMSIPKDVLEKMNEMLRLGSTFAEIYREFGQEYEYMDILYGLPNYSMLGAKRRISNRLGKLNSGLRKPERKEAVAEIREDLEYLYRLARMHGKKLASISKLLDQ